MALALGLVACGNKKTDADGKGAPMIEKSDIKVDGGLMTPEVLWAFGRLSDAKVSADGQKNRLRRIVLQRRAKQEQSRIVRRQHGRFRQQADNSLRQVGKRC